MNSKELSIALQSIYEEPSRRKKNLLRAEKLKSPAEQEESPGAYESDLILSPEEVHELKQSRRVRRKAVQNEAKLWPNGIIPYEFESGMSMFRIIQIFQFKDFLTKHVKLLLITMNGFF